MIRRSDTAAPRDALPQGRRLESWKEIANYLGRTVRTVHRWEKDEGLPVHRHLHQKRGSVYGFSDEIDAWVAARSVAADSRQSGESATQRAAIVLGAVVVLALAVFAASRFLVTEEPVAPSTAGSIAVLPFRSLDGDATDDTLGHGIAEEVMSRLHEVPSLTPIARTSAFAFDERTLDPLDIARRLGVDYVVAGHLEREGEVIRIRIQLIDDRGVQVWGHSFDQRPQMPFEIHDRVARSVVEQLGSRFEVPAPERVVADPEAYKDYLIGREHLRVGQLAEATAAFERAIARDRAYVRPYGGRAMVLALRSAGVMNRVSFDAARAAAEQALSLDPSLAEAHAAMGRIALEQGRLDEAVTALQHALDLDVRLVEASDWLAQALQEQGRYVEAEQELGRALTIDPLHPRLNGRLAEMHWMRGNYEAARARWTRLLDLPDPPPSAYRRLVLLNRGFGRFEAALEWAREAALVHPVYTGLEALIHTYPRLGLDAQAQFWLERLARIERDDAPRLGLHSEFLFMQGRFEEIHALNMQYLERSGCTVAEMPFLIQEAVGGIEVLTGRYEQGIATLEPLFGSALRIPKGLGGRDFALTFAQFLAHAYREVGREADAEQLLARIDRYIRDLQDAGVGNWPNLYVVAARNHVLRGEHEAALRSLRNAVERGWRDLAWERHVPLWTPIADRPELRSIVAEVESDIAAQRERVEARALDPDFATRVEVLLEPGPELPQKGCDQRR